MSSLLIAAKLINIVAILLFAVGLFFVCDKEVNTKHKAMLGVAMAITLALYILLLSLVAIFFALQGKIVALALILFVVVLFPLGHYSKYETVKIFTILQILCFVLSLGILYTI